MASWNTQLTVISPRKRPARFSATRRRSPCRARAKECFAPQGIVFGLEAVEGEHHFEAIRDAQQRIQFALDQQTVGAHRGPATVHPQESRPARPSVDRERFAAPEIDVGSELRVASRTLATMAMSRSAVAVGRLQVMVVALLAPLVAMLAAQVAAVAQLERDLVGQCTHGRLLTPGREQRRGDAAQFRKGGAVEHPVAGHGLAPMAWARPSNSSSRPCRCRRARCAGEANVGCADLAEISSRLCVKVADGDVVEGVAGSDFAAGGDFGVDQGTAQRSWWSVMAQSACGRPGSSRPRGARLAEEAHAVLLAARAHRLHLGPTAPPRVVPAKNSGLRT